MKLLIQAFIVPVLVMSLVTGCGANPALTLGALSQIQNLAKSQSPGAMQAAKTLNIAQLTTLLNGIAASGKLNAAQSAVLADPNHQKVLAGVLQLAAGGSTKNELTAVSAVLGGAAASGQSLSTIINNLIIVFQNLAPIIGTISPQMLPFITVALAILPIVQQVLKVLFPNG